MNYILQDQIFYVVQNNSKVKKKSIDVKGVKYTRTHEFVNVMMSVAFVRFAFCLALMK